MAQGNQNTATKFAKQLGKGVLSSAFPEIYSAASSLSGNKRTPSERDVLNKRERAELRLSTDTTNAILRENNLLIREQITMQNRSLTLLSEVIDAVRERGKKSSLSVPSLVSGGLMAGILRYFGLTVAQAPLIGAVVLANTTTEKEDKIVKDAANASQAAKQKYGEELVSKARSEFQPWYHRGTIASDDPHDEEYVQKYLEKHPEAKPKPVKRPEQSSGANFMATAPSAVAAAASVSTPAVASSTPTSNPTTPTVVRGESAAVLAARERTGDSKGIVTIESREINFLGQKIQFDVDTLTVNSQSHGVGGLTGTGGTGGPGGGSTGPGGGDDGSTPVSTPQGTFKNNGIGIKDENGRAIKTPDMTMSLGKGEIYKGTTAVSTLQGKVLDPTKGTDAEKKETADAVSGLVDKARKFSPASNFIGHQVNHTPNAVFDAIIKAEGTDKHGDPYNTSLGYMRSPKPLTEMTMDEVLAWGDQVRRAQGMNSSAKGAFQIVNSTQILAMKALGISGKALFNEENQKRLASWIARHQGLGAWEGFKLHPDQRLLAERGMREGEDKKTAPPPPIKVKKQDIPGNDVIFGTGGMDMSPKDKPLSSGLVGLRAFAKQKHDAIPASMRKVPDVLAPVNKPEQKLEPEVRNTRTPPPPAPVKTVTVKQAPIPKNAVVMNPAPFGSSTPNPINGLHGGMKPKSPTSKHHAKMAKKLFGKNYKRMHYDAEAPNLNTNSNIA